MDIIKLKDFEKISDLTLTTIKINCKHYKVKQSGKKNIVQERLYNFMRNTYFVKKIQKVWRHYLLNKIYTLNNSRLDRKKCVNTCDFCTLDELNHIQNIDFFSYKDTDNKIYGFDIQSLISLFEHSNRDVNNPYNRNTIQKDIIDKIIEIHRLIQIIIGKRKKRKKNKLSIIELFQIMDEAGNYTDISWFNTLDKNGLISFIYNMKDIWSYRLQLTHEMKCNICHPNGDPFSNVGIRGLQFMNFNIIKDKTLQIIENMITKGTNREYSCLGINYILCGFTLVSQSAASSLPWLYQAVI